MGKGNSVQESDVTALAVLLTAGANPDRLATWYADNTDNSRQDVAAICGLSADVG
ncbi:hypothetical protein [Mycolicibacterium fortuitum]|uniref:hypothetical protein n=1 Tax=Mycolicibacterium fortuitum TaxID=1766 RepID=UPI002639108D|nr:hypothetical protein [Mycolicibacterium fortuitum]